MITPLAWDSNFFGFKIGSNQLNSPVSPEIITALVDQAKQEGYKLLYIFDPESDSTTKRLLTTTGALLADRKVTYVREVPYPAIPFPETVSIYPQTSPSPELTALALQAGRYSRFLTDPHFDPSAYQNLYKTWIAAATAKEMAREVLIYPGNNTLLGMLTVGEKNNRADLGLLAVSEAARGKRIGSALLAASLNLAANWNYREIQLVTQGTNIPACSFFENHGFREEKAILVYHFWLQ